MTDLNLNQKIVEQRRTLKGFNRKMELLQAENRKLQQEIGKWKREALQLYPTPDAYEAVCKALEKHKQDKQILIEGLREYTDDFILCPNCGRVKTDDGETAQRILKEIGVTEAKGELT